MNIITKLKGYKQSAETEQTSKHNASKPKLTKAIATLALASTLALTPLTLTACNQKTENPDPNTDIEKPVAEYSQILQDVLNSDYYNNIIEEYKNFNWYSKNKTLAIPYSFLKTEGFDVAAMLNDEITCSSTSYVVNTDTNTLYLSVKIESPYNDGKYYSCYKLKYTLTNKEYADLYMLHEGNYIQAPFFIQELDKNKTAAIISKTNVDKETLNNLEDAFNSLQIYQENLNGSFSIDITQITDEKHITIEFRSNPSTDMLTKNCKHRILELLIYSKAEPSITNDIYKIGTIKNTSCSPTNLEDFKANYSTITYFNTDNVNKVNVTLNA